MSDASASGRESKKKCNKRKQLKKGKRKGKCLKSTGTTMGGGTETRKFRPRPVLERKAEGGQERGSAMEREKKSLERESQEQTCSRPTDSMREPKPRRRSPNAS